MTSVDIVVPVLDEAGSVDEFCARVQRLGWSSSLIFVDNGSTDGTLARLERFRDARLIRHATNEGYGGSILDGIASGHAERIVVIDADLEYPPEIVPTLVEALGEHPIVYTSRFLGRSRADLPLSRRLGNRAVTGAYNVLFRQRLTDLMTGCKAFRRDALAWDTLRLKGFDHCVELAAALAAAGHTIHEVPIAYAPRTRGVSKMRHLPEAARLLAYMLAFRLRYRNLLRPSSAIRDTTPPVAAKRG